MLIHRCAPPNAVYGIETFMYFISERPRKACCAPPNAVYGIETLPYGQRQFHTLHCCAPPNAVYGIETNRPIAEHNSVVRRLMPFTASKK